MNKKTYFSIIIPTRERSHIVCYAIQCALRQQFDDFEVILVDNDTTTKTAEAVQQFQSNPKFKYFRTGNLSMADNWEFGVCQAQSEYLMILGDKHWLRHDALEILYSALEKEKPEYCSWTVARFKNNWKCYVHPRIPEKENTWINSEEHIRKILKGNDQEFCRYTSWGCLDAVQVKKVRQIQQSPSGRLCCITSPDCTAIFQLLLNTDHFLYLPISLTSVTFGELSNGGDIRMKKKSIETFTKELGITFEKLYEHVPLKYFSFPNIINDFYEMASFHCPEKKFELDIPALFNKTWEMSILFPVMRGVDMTKDIQIFETAIDDLNDTKIQQEIRSQLQSYTYLKPVVNKPLQEKLRKLNFRLIFRFRRIFNLAERFFGKEIVTRYKNLKDFFEKY